MNGKHCVIENAKMGKGCEIGDFVKIGQDGKGETSLGDGCTIRSHSVIYHSVVFAPNVKTGHHVMVRENTHVGEGSLIGSGTIIDGNVKIGRNVRMQSGVYIPPGCTIEDGVFIGPRAIFTNDKHPPSPKVSGSIVKKGAAISAGAIILPGVTVGENALVGAGSVVTRDIPAGEVWVGNPARFIKKRSEYSDAENE